MELRKFYKLSSLLAIVPVIFFLCFMAQPVLAADEATPKEVLTEELPPGEVGEKETFWDRWLFIADVDAFFTQSHLNGGDTVSGGSANALFAPVYRFDDRTFLILMYDGHYYKKLEFYSDEEGPRERTENQAHTFQPMVRFDFGERAQYSLTPSVFHTVTYNKDDDTGNSWSDGLYNYRDYGVGLDFDVRGVYGEEGTLSFGAQYYSREYPNYASLLSLTGLDTSSGLNTEKNEKDYHGVIVKGGYTWMKPLGFSWETEYSLLHRDLDDKKVVDSNGVLTGEEQEDYLHNLDLNFRYMLDIDGGLKLGLNLNGTMNRSNQNYYDGMYTVSLDDDVPISDYYDYNSYRISPNISYTFALFPLTPSFSYAYQKLEYTDRNAKYGAGGGYLYKDDKHFVTQQEMNLGLRYDLTDNWSLLAQWQYIVQRSNNDDQRVYRWEYTINNYSIGFAFKY